MIPSVCVLFRSFFSAIPNVIVDHTLSYHMRISVYVLQAVLDGKYDDLPEQAFYMVGGIDEVLAKAEKISKENA